jgi:hypothetical protein
MNPINKSNDIMERFDQKIEELKKTLPPLGRALGTNCTALTLTNILDVLGEKELKSFYYNNLALPFSDFGGFRGKSNWKAPCGTVCGGLAAIGIIMGGKKKTESSDVYGVYAKGARYATSFENEFGSICCQDICGFDISIPEEYIKYRNNNTWEKTCHKFVLFAIDKVRKLTRRELGNNWD